MYRYGSTFYPATVKEVGSSSPKHVLGGPGEEKIGVIRWTPKERIEYQNFIRGGNHTLISFELRKSIWIVITFWGRGLVDKTLYLCTFEDLIFHGDIILR